MALRRLRRLLPLSNAGLAVWVYRNRDELLGLGGFGVRAARRVAGGDSADVIAEARLRAALLRDPRTRRAAGLQVEVHDGVARLWGEAPHDAHLAALGIAERTKGVRRVLDTVTEVGGRGRFARRRKRAA